MTASIILVVAVAVDAKARIPAFYSTINYNKTELNVRLAVIKDVI